MYLNGDFEGGEFFFAHNNKSEQVGFYFLDKLLVACIDTVVLVIEK